MAWRGKSLPNGWRTHPFVTVIEGDDVVVSIVPSCSPVGFSAGEKELQTCATCALKGLLNRLACQAGGAATNRPEPELFRNVEQPSGSLFLHTRPANRPPQPVPTLSLRGVGSSGPVGNVLFVERESRPSSTTLSRAHAHTC
ncbi:hypothetical protein ZHAS_00016617 [Anopheles sinensis]|uniref:Uncharacterized protein n=1 Tax=Anopheles sinensis TaxID=74873 RepID=A0A084WEI3_ANOSI|nr:hypothetical protein ZHAS_00016617 [Anopheles sinensis]